MQIVSTKASAKVAAVAASLAMASAMLSFVPAVHAASCSVGMTDLQVGSTGDAVKCLQDALINGKYLVMPAGVMTGYFGPLTKTAVMAWQAASKVPSTGYFGPLSRAAFNAAPATPGSSTCTTKFDPATGLPCANPTTPDAPGALEGTDGSISDVNELSSYNNEEVGEGQEDVKVLGAEVEVSNDGDIALKSVKVSFDPSGNAAGDSDHLEDYLKSVSIYLGSEKIGSADAEDFSESSNVYTKTIALSGKTTIKADDSENLMVAVDAADNLDSGDIDSDSWAVDLENIRFVDGSGVYTTETGYEIDGMDVGISFVTFSTAADTNLKISVASDSPKEGIVVVDESETTEDVSLLKGKIKLEGTSDVVIDSFPVTFTVTGAGDLASTTASVKLVIGGEEYTETITSSGVDEATATITFDDLDFAIDAGETVEFEVFADIEDTDGTLDAGDTLQASVTASNRNSMDVENEQNDQLTSSDKSGTATGKAQQFFVNGIGLTLVSVETSNSAGQSANDDLGTFKIKYKVTAIGDTIYVSSLVDAKTSAAVTTGKTSVLVERGTTGTTGGVTVTLQNVTDTTINDDTGSDTGLFAIEEGESETMLVTATVQLPTAGAAGQYRLTLNGVSWTTNEEDATPDNAYTSSLDSFTTGYYGLN